MHSGKSGSFSSLRGTDRKDQTVDKFVRKNHNVLLFTLIAITLILKIHLYQQVKEGLINTSHK
jgi:hypothetical protein